MRNMNSNIYVSVKTDHAYPPPCRMALLACGLSLFGFFFPSPFWIPSLFRKSFRKTRVFLQETLTHRGQQNQQMPEMRSRAGGNPSQGSRSVQNLCHNDHPTVKSVPPLGIPKITFSSVFCSLDLGSVQNTFQDPLEVHLESPRSPKRPK